MEHDHFIKIYDDVLDKNLIKNIMDSSRDVDWEYWDRGGRPQFHQFNVTEYAQDNPDSIWGKIHNRLIEAIKDASERYMEDTDCKSAWPAENALEQIRLKKYVAEDDDRFDPHVDVGDHSSARRFLALFFYLNDVDEGGETWFTKMGIKVKPKAGRCLIFPPTWTYPHAGLPPLNTNKYIIGTYLHYI